MGKILTPVEAYEIYRRAYPEEGPCQVIDKLGNVDPDYSCRGYYLIEPDYVWEKFKPGDFGPLINGPVYLVDVETGEITKYDEYDWATPEAPAIFKDSVRYTAWRRNRDPEYTWQKYSKKPPEEMVIRRVKEP